MVEPVALLLQGRGHRIVRARDAGLADERDVVVVEYALIGGLVVVSFDRDMRRLIGWQPGGKVLHIMPPERTARERLGVHYREVIRLLEGRDRLVTLPATGRPIGGY